MQSRTLPDPDGRLSFDKVVPPDTSTRNVAAAAFHHCLGKVLNIPADWVAVFIDFDSSGDEAPAPGRARAAIRNRLHEDHLVGDETKGK